jgi:type IV secretion system protein VirB1
MIVTATLLACAVVSAAPDALQADDMRSIIAVESGGNEFAINVNQPRGLPPVGPQHPTSAAEAAQIAHRYIAEGYSVDIGIAQVNSRNLGVLGLTVEQALDPCANVAGGYAILNKYYLAALSQFHDKGIAKAAAVSAYNTGDFGRGFSNGYVARVMAASLGLPSKGVKVASNVAATSVAAPDIYSADGVEHLGDSENDRSPQ